MRSASRSLERSLRAHVVVNIGTDSPVSHTESGADMIWPNKAMAARHAYNLTMEYKFTRPELNEPYRTWRAQPATPEQFSAAMAAGAFGPEYESIIGLGQARPDAKGVRDPTTGDGDVEKFREMLDKHGFKGRD